MTLDNIMKMAKADRYTDEGKKEIQDARRYKAGEISEATGLQKQTDGSWAPPKSTKYGKVTTNKEGKVGIQQTLGKGSKFEEYPNEKSASRALANLTSGYNTTERSKMDPHSDEARQIKHWDKEVEQIKKENKADRRAEHAAQFQKQPVGAEDAEYTPESINEPREKLERQLTGDTHLRLSQVQDRVYKIGEISQKTGLMKTEHGWVKPKNGGKAAGSEKSAENKGMEEKKHTLEVGSEIKFKRTGQPITIKNIENYDGTKIVVGEYEYNGKKETNRFRLDQLEYDKDEPKKSNPIAVGNTVKFKRTGQPIKITNVEYYGNTPIIVGEYEYNGKKETNRFRMDQISTN